MCACVWVWSRDTSCLATCSPYLAYAYGAQPVVGYPASCVPERAGMLIRCIDRACTPRVLICADTVGFNRFEPITVSAAFRTNVRGPCGPEVRRRDLGIVPGSHLRCCALQWGESVRIRAHLGLQGAAYSILHLRRPIRKWQGAFPHTPLLARRDYVRAAT
jgi:hypothetical protein